MKLDKLIKFEERFVELEKLLGDQEVIANRSQFQQLAKEYADITPAVTAFRDYKKNAQEIAELEKMITEPHDADFISLAKSELEEHINREKEITALLEEIINPKTQEKNRNLIIEIRAGTGGEEASLFAGDLYRMYTKYADKKGWKVENIESAGSEKGGFKEVIFSISGKGAEQRLKWESGAHRVQRVPDTEASGRIHTSAATVAVLLEPEEVDIVINPSDLKIDIFRSSGPGGQSVNTTDSAVRLTHMPTGVVVVCQDERSQLKNKAKAMRVLRARIMEQRQRENKEKADQDRKLKVGSGDRSEKIRTYNFPDHRVTDHRIGFTSHKLPFILDGDLDEMTEALIQAENEDNKKSE